MCVTLSLLVSLSQCVYINVFVSLSPPGHTPKTFPTLTESCFLLPISKVVFWT